jgi:uncharacterized delta-60 repeat protein
VTVAGTLPIFYQWNFNDQPIAGQTSDRLLLNNTMSAQAGAYTVTATNSRGAVTSAPAALTFVAATAPGPIVDTTFDADAVLTSEPDSVVEQADGKIVLCYAPSRILVRLNVDGSRDPSFNIGTGISGSVSLLVVQPDGRILVSGAFTAIDGLARRGLARLNVDGSVDSLFALPSVIAPPSSGLPGSPMKVSLQTDGKILVVTLTDSRLFRLNNDGSLDSSFVNGTAASLVAPLGNGQLVARTPSGLDLLNSDGTRVGSIATEANSFVRNMSTFPHGSILVEQSKSTRFGIGVSDQAYLLFRLDPGGRRDLAWPGISIRGGFFLNERFAVTPDGKIFRFYSDSDPIKRVIQRFNSDASIDYTFDMRGGPDAGIADILPLRDGRTLVMGGFRRFDGQARSRLARLLAVNAPPRQRPSLSPCRPKLPLSGRASLLLSQSPPPGRVR